MRDEIEKEIKEVTGPFMTKFNKVSEQVGIRKQPYHGGSLIGPDVHKVLNNFEKFSDIILPVQIDTTTGCKSFGSQELSDKVHTMFQKFKSCYDLYTLNRMLCKHEVELLALRCSEFGCWFPVNFPEENLRRKFHLLTVEVPRQARLLGTDGMMSEQAIESIHANLNKYERMYCTVRLPAKRQKLQIRQHAQYSSHKLTHLKL